MTTALRMYSDTSNKAIDWYFVSCKEQNKYKKMMARIKFYETVEKRSELARRLSELCQNLMKK